MNPKYVVGQKVIVRPVDERGLTSRESSVLSYAGQKGEVASYYWISPRTSEVFYIYTIRIGPRRDAVVLYEDELEPALS